MTPCRSCKPSGRRAGRAAGRAGLIAGWVLVVCCAGQAAVAAAETSDPVAMRKTLLVLKLGAQQRVSARAKYRETPPAILVEFPRQQVIGSLPERSTMAMGVIRNVIARYSQEAGSPTRRFLESLEIGLAAPYAYHLTSEPGRILIEISHPASVGGTDMEIGLGGGTLIGGRGRPRRVDQRFRAMQEALARATPAPWSFQLTPDPLEPSEGSAASSGTPASNQSSQSLLEGAPASGPGGRIGPFPAAVLWSGLGLGLALVGSTALWLLRPGEWTLLAGRGIGRDPTTARIPSSMVFIDELVWQAFERQGFQPVQTIELGPPLGGLLRIMMKDGTKAGLLFVGNGPFFEKQTVQRFAHALQEAGVGSGHLVASGSFTVPAQRTAKEHTITLIGREQLAELLSAGARSESITKQLEQYHARLEEAKETLRQFAAELDALRRQRNEASWYLGEERARSAKVESQLEETTQQLRAREQELSGWEQEALKLRKQWEESQWYLGEAQARGRHVTEQLNALQEAADRADRAEREGDETRWYLGEEQAARQALEAQLKELQTVFETSARHEAELQAQLARLAEELQAVREFGERRSGARRLFAGGRVELFGEGADALGTASLRDLAIGGLGLESEQALPDASSLRLRVSLPGQEPVESCARLVWQQASGEAPRVRAGYQFSEISSAARALIEQQLSQQPPSRTG